MSSISRDDILVSLDAGYEARRPLKVQLAAFIPITIAIVGIAVILSGAISAEHGSVSGREAVDPIETGSIGPANGLGPSIEIR